MTTITLDNPALEAAAATFTAKLNADRPKDTETGEFIDPPQTVVDVLTANLAAICTSWKETQDAEFRATMIPIANAMISAPQSVSNDVIAYAKSKLGL